MFIHCGMKKTKGGISKQWNTIPQLAKAGNKTTQISSKLRAFLLV